MTRHPCFLYLALCALTLLGLRADADEPVIDLESKYVVSYYDRNRDGIVDFELHHLPGGADADWALSDTTFRGRFDLRISWGIVITREAVDLPVPKNVRITSDKPPVAETQ